MRRAGDPPAPVQVMTAVPDPDVRGFVVEQFANATDAPSTIPRRTRRTTPSSRRWSDSGHP
jgi:hypothetical protein